MRSRNKLYTILLVACLAGYVWVFYNLASTTSFQNNYVDVCLIKHVTGIPCPSCGSTRSVIALANGDVVQSLYTNPIGLIITIIMLVSPIWILFDLARKKHSLYSFYQQIENMVRRPSIAIPLVLLMLVNWVWNISKGL